ncbi:MAG: ribosome maturation factor RimP [Bacilli bacterium]|nr:ribosome maturation factor RimP [Bacilli bacterium]
MNEKILNAVKEPLKDIEVTISKIEFEKEDGVDTLFLHIESDKTVDTDLCARVSEIVNPIIDELELPEIPEEFVLDICSKGESENE